MALLRGKRSGRAFFTTDAVNTQKHTNIIEWCEYHYSNHCLRGLFEAGRDAWLLNACKTSGAGVSPTPVAVATTVATAAASNGPLPCLKMRILSKISFTWNPFTTHLRKIFSDSKVAVRHSSNRLQHTFTKTLNLSQRAVNPRRATHFDPSVESMENIGL